MLSNRFCWKKYTGTFVCIKNVKLKIDGTVQLSHVKFKKFLRCKKVKFTLK